MDMSKRFDPPAHAAADLDAIYKTRFRDQSAYRQKVWSILTNYFSAVDTIQFSGSGSWLRLLRVYQPGTVCAAKFGMDLNPEARKRASPDVQILEQDCSMPWSIPPALQTLPPSSPAIFWNISPQKPHVEGEP